MRIVLDLQACQSESRFRGIGRYSMSLAKAIARQAGNHDIWIALNARFPDTIPNIRLEFEGLVPKERIVTFSIPGPVVATDGQKGWRACAAEVIREHFLSSLAPDIIHISTAFEGSVEDVVCSIGAFEQDAISSVTLYDLIPLVLPNIYLPTQDAKEFYFRRLELLKKSKCLLAISEYTRQDAIRLLGISSESIFNISAAADDSFKPGSISPEEKKRLQEKYLFKRPIILYSPGGFDERKNIHNLIIAYSNLPPGLRKTHQLLITSQITHSDAKIIHGFAKKQRLGKDELILSGYVPNEDLIALYNLCELFVFPSLYEGFGLPALEAMACGAPVIGSKTTSIPEVIGSADALFDPAQPEAITEMMRHALTEEGFRQSLRKHGLEQARKFSWDNSAKRALEAFEAVYQREKIEGVKTRYYDKNDSYERLLLTLAETKADVNPTHHDVLSAAQAIALNRVSEEPRQLLLDISELVRRDAKSGIQRVVRNIISELLKSPVQGYQVKLVYFDGKCYRYADDYMNDFLGGTVPAMKDGVIDVAHGDIFLGLDLTVYLISKTHDFLKQLNVLGVKVYFVVYDILVVQRPDWWPDNTDKVFGQWLKSIAEVSTGLVCISRSVANDVMEWLAANSPKRVESLPIGYFHLGTDAENSISTTGIPGDTTMILSALSSSPSFLLVGTIEPRKGHAQTLSAFELLWNQGVDANLVIVGKQGWLVENLIIRLSNHPMLGKRLFWLESVSDEYLKEIYLRSEAVIMASEGEGFGLPIIEAARYKIPLILRNLPVFQEIAGGNATYFSGLDAEALAMAIINWLEQDAKGKTPPSDKIRFLSWNESAQSLKNLLQDPFDPNWVNNWQRIHQPTLQKQQTNHS